MNIKNLCCFFLIVLVVAGFSGCKMAKSLKSFEEKLAQPEAHGSTEKTLMQAESAFFSDDYDLARKLYSRVKKNNNESFYHNQAIYGLACLRIITAEDTRELRQALVALSAWQAPDTNVESYLENPRMLITALNNQSDLLDCQVEIRNAVTKMKMEELNRHKQEIVNLQTTIEKLEHQISVLEAIDQEIQEKRKPI